MWKRFLLIFVLTILLSPWESGAMCEDVAEFPFRTGERLTFELKWEFIPAGTMVLEVLPMTEVEGIPARHFQLTVKTNSFVDNFYKVRDTIEAFTDEAMTRSLLYKKRQEEGKHRRDIVVKFDWQKEEALHTNFGRPGKPIKILPRTFDPFSIFYAFRLCKLKENTHLDASVTDGKKCVAGKANVLKRQFVSVKDQKYDTFLIEPDLKDVGGVFKKSKSAKFQIWVTNDSMRLPVRVASSVAVGSFIAELVSVDHRPGP